MADTLTLWSNESWNIQQNHWIYGDYSTDFTRFWCSVISIAQLYFLKYQMVRWLWKRQCVIMTLGISLPAFVPNILSSDAVSILIWVWNTVCLDKLTVIYELYQDQSKYAAYYKIRVEWTSLGIFKNTTYTYFKHWTICEPCNVFNNGLFQSCRYIWRCSFVACFNSLRPSDAYMRQ